MEPYRLLEQAVAEWANFPQENVVCCNSGTSALHLALEAFRLPQGSEVILPDYTMISCARACTLAGLVPVLVDCGGDLLMEPKYVFDHYDVTKDRPSALMLVHIYGRQMRDFSISGAPTIEDMAELHGIKPHSNTDAACWSFYRNKIVCGEEGGAVAFRNPEHAALARQLRSVGFTDAHDYTHIPRGHNYRMANLLAVPIIRSLANVHMNSYARRMVENWWNTALEKLYEMKLAIKMPKRDSPWVYDVMIPGMTDRDQTELVGKLNGEGIAARHGFKPISSQKEYEGCRLIGVGTAARLSSQIIYLPLTPVSTDSHTVRKGAEIILRHLT